MLNDPMRIIQLKNILSFKNYFRALFILALIFLTFIFYIQTKQSIQQYRYQAIISYCVSQHSSPQAKNITAREMREAYHILHTVRLEHMATASLSFEKKLAKTPSDHTLIPLLIQSYIFRIPVESNSRFTQNLKSLAVNLIAKHKKSDLGNALLSAIELNRSDFFQAEKYLSNISKKHVLFPMLDFQISFERNDPKEVLERKLNILREQPKLQYLYNMMQYQYYIKNGNYFAAKPILNKRLLEFPKDYWGQVQLSQILEKGQNLNAFKNALRKEYLSSNYSNIQLSYANLLCSHLRQKECENIYTNISKKEYQMNSSQNQVNAKFQLAFLLLKQNKVQQAFKIIKDIQRSFPYMLNKTNVYSSIAFDMSNTPLPSKLIIALKEQNFDSSEQAIALFILSKHYLSKNLISNFETTIKQLIEQHPEFISGHIIYVNYLVKYKKNKQAIDYANKFIHTRPISPYHIYSNEVSYDAIYLNKSLNTLKNSVNRNSAISKSSIISSYLGLSHLISYMKHLNSNSLNQASYYFKKAINKNRNHEKTYLFLGILYHYKNNITASNRYLNKSYALQEEDNNTFFWFAKNNLALRQNSIAEKTLNRLKNDRTWKWPANNLLALILLEKKQYTQALSMLESLLQIDPNHHSAWHTLNIIEF